MKCRIFKSAFTFVPACAKATSGKLWFALNSICLVLLLASTTLNLSARTSTINPDQFKGAVDTLRTTKDRKDLVVSLIKNSLLSRDLSIPKDIRKLLLKLSSLTDISIEANLKNMYLRFSGQLSIGGKPVDIHINIAKAMEKSDDLSLIPYTGSGSSQDHHTKMSPEAAQALGVLMNAEWYTILGVAETADEGAISKAFRKVSLKWHPDKWSKSLGVTKAIGNEIFKVLNTAKQDGLKRLGGTTPSDDTGNVPAIEDKATKDLTDLFSNKEFQFTILLGVPEGISYSEISPLLKPFDLMHFGKSAFIISSVDYTDPVYGPILTGVNFQTEIVMSPVKGIAGGLNTLLSKIPKLTFGVGQDGIKLSGLVTPAIVGTQLKAELPGQLSFGLKDKVKGYPVMVNNTPITLTIELTGKTSVSDLNVFLDCGMSFQLPGQKEKLTFKVIITVKTNSSIGLAGKMEGMAQLIPKVPVMIGDVWIGASINLLTWVSTAGTFPLEGGQIGGTIDFFDQNVKAAGCLEISETDVNATLLGDYTGDINMRTLLEKYFAFGKKVGKLYSLHPDFEPWVVVGSEVVDGLMQYYPDIIFRKLKLFVGLNDMKCAGTNYPAGLGFAGAVDIGPFSGLIDLELTGNRIAGKGFVKPLTLGPITISGLKEGEDAKLDLALNISMLSKDTSIVTKKPSEVSSGNEASTYPSKGGTLEFAKFAIDGRIKLNIPGNFEGALKADVDAHHANIVAEGMVASLKAKLIGAISLLKPEASTFKLDVQTEGLAQLTEELGKAAVDSVKEAQGTLGTLKEKVAAKIDGIEEKIRTLQKEYFYPTKSKIERAQQCISFQAKTVPFGKQVLAKVTSVIEEVGNSVGPPAQLTEFAGKVGMKLPSEMKAMREETVKALKEITTYKKDVTFPQAVKACAVSFKNLAGLPKDIITNVAAMVLIQVLENQKNKLQIFAKGASIPLHVAGKVIPITSAIANEIVKLGTKALDIKRIHADITLQGIPKFRFEGSLAGHPISFNFDDITNVKEMVASLFEAASKLSKGDLPDKEALSAVASLLNH